jgi:hypothetical protein
MENEYGSLIELEEKISLLYNQIQSAETLFKNEWDPLQDFLVKLKEPLVSDYAPLKLDGNEYELRLNRHFTNLEKQMELESVSLYTDGKLDICSLFDAWRITAFELKSYI